MASDTVEKYEIDGEVYALTEIVSVLAQDYGLEAWTALTAEQQAAAVVEYLKDHDAKAIEDKAPEPVEDPVIDKPRAVVVSEKPLHGAIDALKAPY